jgi:uncharacterized membrane protein YdjX (TVP38/TMEM64 family)
MHERAAFLRSERPGRASGGRIPRSAGEHRRPAWGKLALIAVMLAGLALAWRYTPLKDVVAPERVLEWARELGRHPLAPFALMGLYTPAAFVLFPRPLLTLFAVVAFGPVLGFAYGMAGILLAAVATYYAGIALPPQTLARLGGAKMEPVTQVLRRRGLVAMFAVRVVPVAPFVVEGMIAGAARLSLFDFVAGTFLGMLPGTLTTSVFGDQLATAFEDPSRINGWLVAGAVALFAAMILAVRRWFAREQAKVGEARGKDSAGGTP